MYSFDQDSKILALDSWGFGGRWGDFLTGWVCSVFQSSYWTWTWHWWFSLFYHKKIHTGSLPERKVFAHILSVILHSWGLDSQRKKSFKIHSDMPSIFRIYASFSHLCQLFKAFPLINTLLSHWCLNWADLLILEKLSLSFFPGILLGTFYYFFFAQLFAFSFSLGHNKVVIHGRFGNGRGLSFLQSEWILWSLAWLLGPGWKDSNVTWDFLRLEKKNKFDSDPEIFLYLITMKVLYFFYYYNWSQYMNSSIHIYYRCIYYLI